MVFDIEFEEKFKQLKECTCEMLSIIYLSRFTDVSHVEKNSKTVLDIIALAYKYDLIDKLNNKSLLNNLFKYCMFVNPEYMLINYSDPKIIGPNDYKTLITLYNKYNNSDKSYVILNSVKNYSYWDKISDEELFEFIRYNTFRACIDFDVFPRIKQFIDNDMKLKGSFITKQYSSLSYRDSFYTTDEIVEYVDNYFSDYKDRFGFEMIFRIFIGEHKTDQLLMNHYSELASIFEKINISKHHPDSYTQRMYKKFKKYKNK